ncbi:MAG: TetR/AcrR family transcriptional regulator C-terminal domain-containing protein [Actinomycetota bacterium]|nr:TetR/AcrR family transcriptional regulator C-terminal domain-containing protein [Actinomycetota bacterium]
MPRPRSLSDPVIAAAALAVIDRDGLSGLSMRAVASQLDMGAMSLYRYVDGRQEIERLVVDLVFRSVDPVVSRRASWTRQITELSERVYRSVAAHPAVIPLLLVHFQFSPSAWRWLDAVLRSLTRAGFTAPQRVVAVRCLQAYVIGALESQALNPLSGEGTASLTGLSLTDYPLIIETALTALTVTPEQEFGDGLAIVLEGLRAIAPGAARHRPRSSRNPGGRAS